MLSSSLVSNSSSLRSSARCSMLPIAYDHVSASRSPELPRARSLVIRALFFGTLATALAMVYFYTINPMQDGNENVFHSIRCA
ncbi:hypothetical protein TL16_g05827 [Triparma laevis f. inornata]|uniref:Uncharacterized protein n=1 Tax=Triparma laevis f. inornata TaxID=1714386 RepID=A0A9W7AHV7_9STRA|nr:hypothetical protein TL16_g05827 [Triparma laevis f. inornata]